jgi:uncharacterized lipoprotein YmbA
MKRWMIVTVALALAACEQKPKTEPEVTSLPLQAPRAELPTSAASPEKETVNVDAVPTREDFEEEAKRSITADNLQEQLEALEKEVDEPG